MKEFRKWIRELGEPILCYLVGYEGSMFLLELIFAQLGMPVSAAELNGVAMSFGLVALMPQITRERRRLDQERKSKINLTDAADQIRTSQRRGKRFFAAVGRVLQWILLAVFAVCSAIVLNQAVSALQLSAKFQGYHTAESSLYSVPVAIGILTYGFVSPFAEEALFRYLLLNRVRRLTGNRVLAVLFSALLFGIYHGNVVQGIYAAAIGVLIAVSYLYFDHYLAAFLFHMSANLSVYLLSQNKRLYQKILEPRFFAGYVVIMIVLFLIDILIICRRGKRQTIKH